MLKSVKYVIIILMKSLNRCTLLYFTLYITFFAGLRSLDANHNEIHTLPDELGDLRQLEQLYLRHNKITHLPLLRNCAGLKVKISVRKINLYFTVNKFRVFIQFSGNFAGVTLG